MQPVGAHEYNRVKRNNEFMATSDPHGGVTLIYKKRSQFLFPRLYNHLSLPQLHGCTYHQSLSKYRGGTDAVINPTHKYHPRHNKQFHAQG